MSFSHSDDVVPSQVSSSVIWFQPNSRLALVLSRDQNNAFAKMLHLNGNLQLAIAYQKHASFTFVRFRYPRSGIQGARSLRTCMVQHDVICPTNNIALSRWKTRCHGNVNRWAHRLLLVVAIQQSRRWPPIDSMPDRFRRYARFIGR